MSQDKNTSSMVYFWGWIREDEERLRQEGGRKVAIVDGWNRFSAHHHNDNAAAELAINSALEAARETGETRWELLLRHWRLQLWLSGDLHRVLPEAVDLLDLAEDPRVQDVPQRVCAFHDIVDCHVQMDAAGYAEEIAANSQQVLSQLPRKHTCGDCARLHLATAAAARGDSREAEQWVARFYADAYDARWPGAILGIADVYEQLGKWDEAEKAYQKACDYARNSETASHYLSGSLGIARSRAGKGDGPGATQALRSARHTAKYTGGAELLARSLAVEGYVAEAVEAPSVAIDYLTRSARQYLELARYRDAARTALHAAELAKAGQGDGEEALALAARAVGNTPPSSRDLRQRLAALGRQPIQPAPEGRPPATSTSASTDPERAHLQETLEAHIAHGNVRGVALALYRLGRYAMEHDEPRAAVDYLIANAAVERILELGMSDREDALGALQRLQEELPPGTVQAALLATESAPPRAIAPLMDGYPPAKWRWLVRAIAAEVAGKPVVEPEPVEREQGGGFEEWLDHVASMTALVLRFRDQADPAGVERWAATMDETAAEIEQELKPGVEGHEIVDFARGLAALSRGTPPEQIIPTVPAPFDDPLQQIIATSKEPLWHHPGISSQEFLVEQAAQRAVAALRHHDEHRARRLVNMTFRFELMALDLRTQEPLVPIADFVGALAALLTADGAKLPQLNAPLEAPFDAVLAAVYEAGKQPEPTDGE